MKRLVVLGHAKDRDRFCPRLECARDRSRLAVFLPRPGKHSDGQFVRKIGHSGRPQPESSLGSPLETSWSHDAITQVGARNPVISGPGMRLGIDLGGSKIELIAFDASGRERLRQRIRTPGNDYRATLEAICDLIARSENELGASGSIGIGTPGSLSRVTGRLRNSNSACLNGQALVQDLEALLGRPVRIANDANCFALSEATDGAAIGAEVVFGVILGTGVGGGIVVRGRALEVPTASLANGATIPFPGRSVKSCLGRPVTAAKPAASRLLSRDPGWQMTIGFLRAWCWTPTLSSHVRWVATGTANQRLCATRSAWRGHWRMSSMFSIRKSSFSEADSRISTDSTSLCRGYGHATYSPIAWTRALSRMFTAIPAASGAPRGYGMRSSLERLSRGKTTPRDCRSQRQAETAAANSARNSRPGPPTWRVMVTRSAGLPLPDLTHMGHRL